jgi:hypothetical protein
MYRGRLLILMMFGTAAVVAGFAIWYRHQQSNRVLEKMPASVAALIAYAPQAVLQQVVPEKNAAQQKAPAEIIRLQGQPYWVLETKNGISLRDFSAVRGWLIHNDNYDWSALPKDHTGNWQYGILFSNGADQTEILFDNDNAQMLLPDGAVLNTTPMINGLKSFFGEQFPPAKADLQKPE